MPLRVITQALRLARTEKQGMVRLRDSNTHLNKSEHDNSKPDKSELLSVYKQSE